jgi:hypothetical protein
VENVGVKVSGKAIGLYKKHQKYSEWWNLWHPMQSAYDIQQVQLVTRDSKILANEHQKCVLGTFKIESFHSADEL